MKGLMSTIKSFIRLLTGGLNTTEIELETQRNINLVRFGDGFGLYLIYSCRIEVAACKIVFE